MGKINNIDLTNSKVSKIIETLKGRSVKDKRKMLCRELLKHRKYKEYIKLKCATDEEVEVVFNELYKPFYDDIITINDYE